VTKNTDLLILHFLEAVILVRVFVAVEASKPDPGRKPENLLNAELAVVINGIEIAANDVAEARFAEVYADGGAVAQHWNHAVAANRNAFSLIKLNAVIAKVFLAKAKALALILLNYKSSRSGIELHLAEEWHLYFIIA